MGGCDLHVCMQHGQLQMVRHHQALYNPPKEVTGLDWRVATDDTPNSASFFFASRQTGGLML